MTLSLDSGTFVLDTGEQSEMELLAKQLTTVAPGRVDDLEWIAAARDFSCHLPGRLREHLRRFRADPGPHGVLHLRNLPVRPDVPTPSVPGSVERNATLSAAVLTLCMLSLGEVIAFRNEKSGALVQNVVPVPGQEAHQSNAGSIMLEMHVENVHHEHRPDFVSLLCLRNDHEDQAGLQVASIRDALPLLSPVQRRILGEPRFESTPPSSFGGAGGNPVHAVLNGAYDDPDIRVDFCNTRPTDEAAAAAFLALRNAIEVVRTKIVLSAGDLAVVDNRVTLHGRTAFVPRYDGQDRWLQRAFVHVDHRRSRFIRDDNGNVLT
ncbi:TauD/TfdA family dioxygenase [Amycolatopsis sp. cg5]|uniref:TauD/TfdA family dioxygenase n=1 Tax=Amycolatopsis sp. cg5 TaxID=3238802 RepID=UPI003523F684